MPECGSVVWLHGLIVLVHPRSSDAASQLLKGLVRRQSSRALRSILGCERDSISQLPLARGFLLKWDLVCGGGVGEGKYSPGDLAVMSRVSRFVKMVLVLD